jgi:hypothetical protein
MSWAPARAAHRYPEPMTRRLALIGLAVLAAFFLSAIWWAPSLVAPDCSTLPNVTLNDCEEVNDVLRAIVAFVAATVAIAAVFALAGLWSRTIWHRLSVNP